MIFNIIKLYSFSNQINDVNAFALSDDQTYKRESWIKYAATNQKKIFWVIASLATVITSHHQAVRQ